MLAWLKDVWHRLAPATGPVDDRGAGARGEQAAAEFLRRRHGFSIITRNWHSPRDRRHELDIVAHDGDVLVFVEVKARDVGALVPGFEAIGERKRRALRRAIHAYLTALPEPPRTFRFDVVEVTLSDRLPSQCLHFENVALFPKGYHVARQSGALAQLAGED
jgi:putative endonuclease